LAGLAFLPAEAATHSPNLHGYGVRGLAQYLRDVMLYFAWMLGGAEDEHIAVFLRDGTGNLPLQIKMILATASNRALDDTRCVAQAGLHIATRHELLIANKRGGLNGLLDRKRWRFRIDLDLSEGSRRASESMTRGHHRKDGFSVKANRAFGQKRVIAPTGRADVVMAQDIGRTKNIDYARRLTHSSEINIPDSPTDAGGSSNGEV